MEYRKLGRSGLKVSALSIGTVTFGNDGSWGNTELKDAQRQIDHRHFLAVLRSMST